MGVRAFAQKVISKEIGPNGYMVQNREQ